jgi:hypothetical protein
MAVLLLISLPLLPGMEKGRRGRTAKARSMAARMEGSGADSPERTAGLLL